MISTFFSIILASAGFTEAIYISCNRSTFDTYVNNYCLPAYNKSMASSNFQDRCPWPSMRGSYIMLNKCVDNMVRLSRCIEPSVKDQVFLEIHRAYFSLCTYKEGPDLQTWLLLVLPCILATLILPFACMHITTSTGQQTASPGL